MGNRDSADDDRDRAEAEQEDRTDDEPKKDPYEDVAAKITFTATTSVMLNQ
jgi:hypothetical protein